jgi:Uncharacterised nucleotidyltransferase
MLGLTNIEVPEPAEAQDTERRSRVENALLVACVRPSVTQDSHGSIRHLTSQCHDWRYLLETARRHGVTNLLATRLQAIAADLVPLEHLVELRRRLRSTATRNLFLTQELLALIREFSAHGIEAIPFKGPILAVTIYRNLALREFMDLDILVPKHHLLRAGQLLTQRGYHQPLEQTGEPGSAHVESQIGCDFFRRDGKVSVELHWSFLQRWLGFELELGPLWNRPAHVILGGSEVLALSPEVTLLYLCAHGTKHRWSRLCWVADLAQLLYCQPSLDWDCVFKTAERIGSRRTLFLGLHLAGYLLGSEMPANVCLKIKKDAIAVSLAQRLAADFFTSGKRASLNNPGLARDWFYLQTRERWRDRLRYLRYSAGWFLLPSQKDKQWVRLPAGLAWLYLFLRPLRVACDSVRFRFQRMY